MSEFKTVSVSVSFEVCFLHENDSKTQQVEIAMEAALESLSPAIGKLAASHNISISSAEFTAEVEGQKAKYKAPAMQMMAEYIRQQQR